MPATAMTPETSVTAGTRMQKAHSKKNLQTAGSAAAKTTETSQFFKSIPDPCNSRNASNWRVVSNSRDAFNSSDDSSSGTPETVGKPTTHECSRKWPYKDTDDQNQCHGVENPDLYHSRMDKKKLYKLN
jgi:hypothetical protein